MRIAIIGAGGHAKVVMDAALASGMRIIGLVDDAPPPEGFGNHKVVRDIDELNADSFVVAVGDNRVRERLFTAYRDAGYTPMRVVHPSAVLAEGVKVGAGTVVLAGVVVNTGTVIAENAILNTACSVDHDCTVGAHCHVAPGVRIAGGVALGEGAFLGIGSCVTPGVTVGAWAVAGAGAAVVGDVPPGVTVVGVPARETGAE